MQTIHSPNDLAKLLGINTSTLRKYAEILEKHGYRFHKSERGHRGYYDKDVIAFRKFIELNKNSDMTLEMSAKAVASVIPDEEEAVNDTEITIYKRYESDIAELKEMVENQRKMIEKQNELLEKLTKRLDEQQNFLSNRDQQIMNAIRDIQETKRLTAASSERKSLWNRLFGR